MVVAAREARRQLAVDVRGLVWQQKKFDADRFIRTGQLIEWGNYGVPDTPGMRAAKAKIGRDREIQEQAG